MKFNIALELDRQSLGALGAALAQAGPYALIHPIVASIDAQVKAQQQRTHDAAADLRSEPLARVPPAEELLA